MSIRHATPSATCFVCQREVLQFPGEFTFFDPYLLSNSREDDQHVVDAGAVGFAHAACLKSSKWGNFWRKRWEWTFPNLWGQPLVWRDASNLLFLNNNTQEFALISGEGIRTYWNKNDLKAARKWKDGYLISREMELYHHFPDAESVRKLKAKLDAGEEITLLDFATVLGLEDTILHPEVLSEGRFASTRALRRYLKGKLNFVPIVLRMYLPEGAYQCIFE
jgi:hypothetical protein